MESLLCSLLSVWKCAATGPLSPHVPNGADEQDQMFLLGARSVSGKLLIHVWLK